ncbi:hypothetical protein Q8A73_024415, partial [Channa argus]
FFFMKVCDFSSSGVMNWSVKYGHFDVSWNVCADFVYKDDVAGHFDPDTLMGVGSCSDPNQTCLFYELLRPKEKKNLSRLSLETFHMISHVIRFEHCDTRAGRRERDKLAAIRYEHLVPFRGRYPFRQYMPNKPSKYGIKIWAACDAKSSYAWNMQQNQGIHVVMEMSEGLQGHNITYELQKRKLTMLGTISRNKPKCPSEIVKMQGRYLYSSIFVFTEKATVVSYCPKRNKNVLKLQMILDYNSTKGGHKTACWPFVILYNIVNASAHNAYVLFTEINQQWNAGKLPARSPAAAAVIEKVKFVPSNQSAMDPMDTG